MPILDKPLEELRAYGGVNPRPTDFDRFWEAGLSEMRSIGAGVEIVPAGFDAPFADCSHLSFTGVGGARIHAKLLRPKQRAHGQPAVLMFHGYAGNSGDWADKLSYVAQGYTVAAMDCRGQGGLSETAPGRRHAPLRGLFAADLNDPPESSTFRSIYLDAAQLASIVMGLEGVDPERVGAMGGSQGGALTLACAALEPRVRRAAPVYPFLCDFKRVWDMDLCDQAYAELRDWFRRFDPTHAREAEIFTRLGYLDIQFLAPRIKAEVLMGTGLMDRICPPSTQFAAYNRIRAPKNMIVYPDFGHESLPGFLDASFTFMMGL